MVCPYYHFDSSSVWSADELVHELNLLGIHASRIGEDVGFQVEIDRLTPITSRVWSWIQHKCFRKWDVLISFTKERFLRNVEIEVYREFSNEYHIYFTNSIDVALKKLGCLELLTDDDELAIANRIGR